MLITIIIIRHRTIEKKISLLHNSVARDEMKEFTCRVRTFRSTATHLN